MRKFVERSAAENAQNEPNQTRAQKAAQAKVHVGGTALKNRQPEQQNSSARRQSGSAVNSQAVPLPNLPQRGFREGQAHPDRYDTDADSLDTTTLSHSVIKLENNRDVERQKHMEAENDNDGRDHGASSDTYEFHRLVEYFNLQDMSREAQEARLKQGGYKWWDDDGEEAPSERDGRSSSPSPGQPPIMGLPTRQPGHPITKHEPQIVQPGTTMSKTTTVFQKSAAIRKEERAPANLAVRGRASYQGDTDLLAASQPPASTQTNREPVAPAGAVRQYGQTSGAYALGHPSFKPVSQPFPPQHSTHVFPPPGKPAETVARGTRHAQAVPKTESTAHQEPVIPDTNIGKHIEDYDTPALFEKSYEELKVEDFDTVPRGQRRVLSEDMTQKPLADRLSHVHKNLNPGDQEVFFRALPSREWEEAGDWCLDQFRNIITGIKEARQKKRKLARDFEDEVEKRYRQVAKRQQNVKDALDKMKQQGENLVPKSPRPSRTPKKR